MSSNSYREADELGRARFNQDFGDWFITAGTQDIYDQIDMYATAKTATYRTYAIEIKCYENADHPRAYAKFTWDGIDHGYMIDYAKVDNLVKVAAAEGRIPILYVRFSDLTIVWDLREVEYESRKRLMQVNKDGQNYGEEKEEAWVTYLYKCEAKYVKETCN